MDWQLASLNRDERHHQPGRLSVVGLYANHRPGNNRNLIDSVRPVLGQRAVIVIKEMVGWGSASALTNDMRVSGYAGLSRCPTPFRSMTSFAPKLNSPSNTLASASLSVHVPSAKSSAASFAGSPPVGVGLLRKLRYVHVPANGLLTIGPLRSGGL
jgi:hypothetical protein